MRHPWNSRAFLFTLMLAVTSVTWAAATGTQHSTSAQRDDLEIAKLRQEVRKLELENESSESALVQLLAWAPFLTVLVALLGAGLTIWKQIDETSHRQEMEIRQREQENLRRFQENFAINAKNLGDASVGVQAGAAASLMTFLKPQYRDFSEDVFLLLLANLKVERDLAVSDLLVRAFEKALPLEIERVAERVRLAKQQEKEPPQIMLDLARTYLYRANLSNLDGKFLHVDIAYANLNGANLADSNFASFRAFGAKLRKAQLSRANLLEAGLNSADAREAYFHGTNLVSAKLKQAKLSKAQFQQARLQEAHLENASLQGARFEGANLNNAFFAGAVLDVPAKRSITRALNWKQANFDDEVREELQRLASG